MTIDCFPDDPLKKRRDDVLHNYRLLVKSWNYWVDFFFPFFTMIRYTDNMMMASAMGMINARKIMNWRE